MPALKKLMCLLSGAFVLLQLGSHWIFHSGLNRDSPGAPFAMLNTDGGGFISKQGGSPENKGAPKALELPASYPTWQGAPSQLSGET
jgi:hypothetical protein